MKHSNFENELNEIRRRAINELKDAIKAHGDGVVFHKEVKLPKLGGEIVWIREDGTVIAFIPLSADKSQSKWYNVFNDLPIEDIVAITEAIPETTEVNDVTGVYHVPITWVDRDDIENEGFDTSDLTQEKLNRIAEIMQEYSCLPTQHEIRTSDLYAACTKVELKQKED